MKENKLKINKGESAGEREQPMRVQLIITVATTTRMIMTMIIIPYFLNFLK